jgi:hypothetical protein
VRRLAKVVVVVRVSQGISRAPPRWACMLLESRFRAGQGRAKADRRGSVQEQEEARGGRVAEQHTDAGGRRRSRQADQVLVLGAAALARGCRRAVRCGATGTGTGTGTAMGAVLRLLGTATWTGLDWWCDLARTLLDGRWNTDGVQQLGPSARCQWCGGEARVVANRGGELVRSVWREP